MPDARDLSAFRSEMDAQSIGAHMHGLMAELYPICRSLTGDGVRETLRILRKQVPLTVHEVPTGTQVFDWVVPREWNVRDAWIKDSTGRRVVDFQRCNLHVVGYSVPVRARLSLEELKPHLFTLPEHPDWIPFRTSYYHEDWGFCLTHNQLQALGEGQYEVCIDSSLSEGSLTYGEFVIQGSTADEILISCHVCHPSLCNENLSGVVLASLLARSLAGLALRYTYRFLFIPTTIGSITWLARNRERAASIRHGLVVACVGDPGQLHYKRSRRGDAEIDRAAAHVLEHCGDGFEISDFSPYGFDERQYSSPGFDLPVGVLTRSTHDGFAQYHTSADDLDLVRPEYLADSFEKYVAILDVLENNVRYESLNPYGEPQLGRRGLYRRIAGQADGRSRELPLLWVLNLADGTHTLLDIAQRARLPFDLIKQAADALREAGLLARCGESGSGCGKHWKRS